MASLPMKRRLPSRTPLSIQPCPSSFGVTRSWSVHAVRLSCHSTPVSGSPAAPRLTGTADAQYEEWQNLLRQMFISETGFVPEDIEVYAESANAPDAPPAESVVDPSAPLAANPADVQAVPEAHVLQGGPGGGKKEDSLWS